MNRISLHISSLVKHCNSVAKLILLIVLTGCINSVFAQTTLNKNYTSGKTTITGNAQTVKTGDKPGDKEYKIQNDGTTVTIKGNLTIAPGTKLEITNGATLVVEGDLVIGSDNSTEPAELFVKNSSILVVKGNVIINDKANLKGEGSNTMIVVQQNLTIYGDSGKPSELSSNDGAAIIIEKDLILSGGTNAEGEPEGKAKVEREGSITIKGKLSGSGKLEFMGNQNDKGYFTVLGGLAEGVDIDNITIKIDHLKQVVDDHNENNLLYISGVGDISLKDKEKGKDKDKDTYVVNASNINSTAYTTSMANIAAANTAGLLPIELVSFQATATNNGFVFNWVTASEDNNDYFTLEYSINGVDFNEIDYVHGAGTTSETSEYEYRWDEAPEFDMVYFRLKQTDYNGEYSYSDVIVASRKKSSGANGTFRYGPLNLQIQDGELRYIVK